MSLNVFISLPGSGTQQVEVEGDTKFSSFYEMVGVSTDHTEIIDANGEVLGADANGDQFKDGPYVDGDTFTVRQKTELEVTVADLRKDAATIRRMFKDNPMLTLVLNVSGKVTQNGKLRLDNVSEDVPKAVRSLWVKSSKKVRSISSGFLRRCATLRYVGFSEEFSSVEHIGSGFMASCRNIESVNVECFSSVRQIDDEFLVYCQAVTKLDLSFMSRLRSTGCRFLYSCTNLTSVVLPPRLRSVGDNFLGNCVSLCDLDASPLSSLTEIAAGFLSVCLSLNKLDLTGLGSLVSIGPYFLASCPVLNALSLPDLTSVEKGQHFLKDCRMLPSAVMLLGI